MARGHAGCHAVHMLHQGWVCLSEGQEARCSCCILFEAWLAGGGNGSRGGNGTVRKGGQSGGTEEGRSREEPEQRGQWWPGEMVGRDGLRDQEGGEQTWGDCEG